MDGLILVHKPLYITSHDVVASLRKILVQKKIGHFGTLDPMAVGLLLAAVGKATRLFPFFSKMDKTYEGRIRLGFSTDTYDAAGRSTSTETSSFPDIRIIATALHQVEGEVSQLPPPYSAKKHQGRPLYTYARRNKTVEGRPFQVRVHAFHLKAYSPPYIDFEVRCSSGTYIRTLAHDLGQKLGCGAHLSELVRTEIGEFKLQDALTLEEIRMLQENGETEKFLRPMKDLLAGFPKIILNDEGVRLVQNGHPVSQEHIPIFMADILAEPVSEKPVYRLFSPDGRLIALARPQPGPPFFAPFLVLI